MKRAIPERGDILQIDLEPATGREQRGRRPVLVLSPIDFNKFGLILICPITSGGEFARKHGFAVPLDGLGLQTQGTVLCHQIRTIDHKERGGIFIEKLPQGIVTDVLARVRTIVD